MALHTYSVFKAYRQTLQYKNTTLYRWTLALQTHSVYIVCKVHIQRHAKLRVDFGITKKQKYRNIRVDVSDTYL